MIPNTNKLLCVDYIVIIFLASFSHQHWLMVFHWSLSDSKSPQVSRTLLSILTDSNNAILWMVLIHPPNSNSFNSLSWFLEIVLSMPITLGITITLMFQSFLSSLASSKYLSLFLLSFIFFTLWSTGMAKSTIYYYYYSSRVFHISMSWWFFSGVWVTASLLDSSQYSGRPQQCCRLDSLYPSANFQVLQAL